MGIDALGNSFLGFLVIAALLVPPFWRLLPNYGLPSWAAAAAVVPFGAIVLLWLMAFRRNVGGDGGARL
jgi:hypothetical protein